MLQPEVVATQEHKFSAAFELARTDVGCVFANQGDNNVERIQRSKYFQALLQKSKANVSEQRNATCQEFSVQWAPCVDESQAEMENEKLSIRASKLMMQTKLTSLYSKQVKIVTGGMLTWTLRRMRNPMGNCRMQSGNIQGSEVLYLRLQILHQVMMKLMLLPMSLRLPRE